MAKIYYRQVRNEKRTIDEVPKLWREKVQKMLDEEA